MHDELEKILLARRGYVSRYPDNRKAVIIISGGLDSVVTSAYLMEKAGVELFPLHIRRGQTNSEAENASVDFFTGFLQEKYGKQRFRDPMKIAVNVPPKEFKPDLLPYVKRKGHPMRDPLMHLLGVEYAVAVSQKCGADVRTVYCAIVPDDYFPHSTLAGLRANTINTCINMGDWDWQITAPNIDPYLTDGKFGKIAEIRWAARHGIPVERTISCNSACPKTGFLACGQCDSCERRRRSFADAGCPDPTEYAV